jgi:hypothetical protein
MNGNTWKTIVAGIAIGLGTALVVALWTGSNSIASLKTGQTLITKQLDSLALDVKENRRLLFEDRSRVGRIGGRL